MLSGVIPGSAEYPNSAGMGRHDIAGQVQIGCDRLIEVRVEQLQPCRHQT